MAYGIRREITQEVKNKFIEHLRELPNVQIACYRLRINRSHIYSLRNSDPDFKEAWDEAIEIGVATLEEAAFNRGKNNSDTMAIFLLKAYKPEVYNQPNPVAVDVTSKGQAIGHPTYIEVALPEIEKGE